MMKRRVKMGRVSKKINTTDIDFMNSTHYMYVTYGHQNTGAIRASLWVIFSISKVGWRCAIFYMLPQEVIFQSALRKRVFYIENLRTKFSQCRLLPCSVLFFWYLISSYSDKMMHALSLVPLFFCILFSMLWRARHSGLAPLTSLGLLDRVFVRVRSDETSEARCLDPTELR